MTDAYIWMMAGNDIEQALRSVDWSANGADPVSIVTAFRHLRQVRTEPEGNRAYAEVLDAIGHNHSGWLHDAAAPAAPILTTIVRDTTGWARRTALEILIDCLGWVRPEQRFVDGDGHGGSVKDALHHAVASLEPELRLMAADSDTTVPIGKSAADLLDALADSM